MKLLLPLLFLTGCTTNHYDTSLQEFYRKAKASGTETCYKVTVPEELKGDYCTQYKGTTP